ncbi:hypothetical protein, partial [Mesorhizobium sp.]|uniref:hypothetical protein n=1 Tax=Mesorhizobium sp. TaxID=1871066 RepID=UPI0025FBADC1
MAKQLVLDGEGDRRTLSAGKLLTSQVSEQIAPLRRNWSMLCAARCIRNHLFVAAVMTAFLITDSLMGGYF